MNIMLLGEFLEGMGFGVLGGVLLNYNKYTKIFTLILLAVSLMSFMYLGGDLSESFIDTTWSMEISGILGNVMGYFGGKMIAEEIKNE